MNSRTNTTICHRVRVNVDGYAYSGGQYFGAGLPLYYVEFPDGRSGHVRAPDRDGAIKTAQDRLRYWGIR